MHSTYYLQQLDLILPNPSSKFYLGYILNYINRLKDKTEVASLDIANSSGKLFTAKTVGHILACFPIKRRGTSRYDKITKARPRIKLWNISDLQLK